MLDHTRKLYVQTRAPAVSAFTYPELVLFEVLAAAPMERIVITRVFAMPKSGHCPNGILEAHGWP